jgi:hypothetical protein
LYFYDGFNYTNNTKLGATSGTNGWVASTAAPSPTNRAGSLTYTGLPTSTGGKLELGGWRVSLSPTASRSLWTAAPGLNNTNLFASFLMNVASIGTSQSNAGSGNFVFQLRTGKANVVISNNVLNALNYNIGIQANGGSSILWDNNGGSGYAPNTTLFVVFSYTNSTVDPTKWGDQLWINPALTATPGAANVSAAGFYAAAANEGVSFGDGNAAGDPALRSVVYVDELRVGSTWGDVVIPEPATVGMLGLGAVIMLLIRRIRRN